MQAVEDHDNEYLKPIGNAEFEPVRTVEPTFQDGNVEVVDPEDDDDGEDDDGPSEEDAVGAAVAAPMGQYETVGEMMERTREEGVAVTIEELGPDLNEVATPYFKDRIRLLQGNLADIEKKMRKLNSQRISAQEEMKILLGLDHRIVTLEQGSLFDTEHAAEVARQQALPQQRCVCGDPESPGVVHRLDGPCYMAEPAKPLTEEELLAQNQTHLPIDAEDTAQQAEPQDPVQEPSQTDPAGAVVAIQEAKERRAARQQAKPK